MKLSAPRWWYVRNGAPGPVLRTVLRPASWLWAAVTARRIARTVPADPGAPVVSIGNLTVGGSGKTPIARETLRILREAGIAAHGLSRGYGGKLEGPVRVDPAVHAAADVGDEPLMLGADGPFWTARDRLAGARAAVAQGAQVIVLDDGHQNPALRKALSIVVVDGETRGGEWPFGDCSVFPSGPMREPLAAGMARADAVVVMLPSGLEAVHSDLLRLFGDKPVFTARLHPLHPPPVGNQLGFAGVAKPWKVERALKAAGCELVDFASYPDHHPWSEGDLRYLVEQADSFNAGLVTTEKDWVRLPPAWRERIACWPVVARFDDEAGLRKLLLERVGVGPAVSDGTSSPPASRTAHVRVRSRPKAGRPAPR